MSLTDRILPRYILSRVHDSVRPSNVLYAKNNNKLPRKPTFAYLIVELTSGAAGHNTLSDGHGWIASDPSLCRYNCGNSLLSRTDWPKTTKINQSKQRQLEIIHSRLEQCGLEIITWPMLLLCVYKSTMKNCFLMLSFLKIQIILLLDRLRCGA